MHDMLYALCNTTDIITMYYWLIDSGGVMPIIHGEAKADEFMADSDAAASPSVRTQADTAREVWPPPFEE
jgi:hypothetical protein